MTTPMADAVVLTGVEPTGRLHLGNYLGAVRPAIDLPARRAYFFIADYHALTTLRDPERLDRHVAETAAAWLAVGLDPRRTVFFRQSAVPEIFELMWCLACTAAKGLLNRAHAYKAAAADNREAGRDGDAGISAGLFNYPLRKLSPTCSSHASRRPAGATRR